MHLDISRDSFRSEYHFLRVPIEQGRPLIDADLNEQTSILLYRLHTLARDLFGDAWAADETAFQITGDTVNDIKIGGGHIYVSGQLIENDSDVPVRYLDQPDLPINSDTPELANKQLLVYLDVRERGLTEVSLSGFRDPALNSLAGPSRSKLVWQVRIRPLSEFPEVDDQGRVTKPAVAALTKALMPPRLVRLAARPVFPNDDPAASDADSQYRGFENQLYRVEVHRTGRAAGAHSGLTNCATFKWSRDNGTAVFPIAADGWTFKASDEGARKKKKPAPDEAVTFAVKLASAGRDGRGSLKVGDWVEYVDEHLILNPAGGEASPNPSLDESAGFEVPGLFCVDSIDQYEPTLIMLRGSAPSAKAAKVSFDFKSRRPNFPYLRRWDQRPAMHPARRTPPENCGPRLADDNALAIVVEKAHPIWIDLEDGVQISFSATDENAIFQRGDYWLIPARHETGQVVWPKDSNGIPNEIPPTTCGRFFVPLAAIKATAANAGPDFADCRTVRTQP